MTIDPIIDSEKLAALQKANNLLCNQLFDAQKIIKSCKSDHEKNKLRDALKKSEDRFRFFAKNSSDGIVIFNDKRQIEFASISYKEQLGISEVDFFDRTSENIFQMIHPDDRQRVFNSVSKAIDIKGAELLYSYRIKQNGGGYIWREDNAHFFYKKNGSFNGAYVVCRDISIRKKNDEILAKSNLRWKSIFINSPIGIALIDANSGHMYEVNPFFTTITGRTSENFYSINWLENTYMDDIGEESKHLALMKAGKTEGFHMRKRYVRPDKTIRRINLTIANLPNYDIIHPQYICMIEDITEFVRSEELLQKFNAKIERSEKRYSDLFNLSLQAMLLYDPQTFLFIHVNKAAVALYQYTEAEFCKMTIFDIITDDRPSHLNTVQKNLSTYAKEEFSFFAQHHKRSGELIDVEIYNSSIIINDKTLQSAIIIDITEKKQFEDKISKAIIKAQEDERYEIGGELHDNVCQLLAASHMSLSMLRSSIPETRMKYYNQCVEEIKLASDEVRNLSHHLAPAFLKDSSLAEAINRMLNTFQIEKECEVKLDFNKTFIDNNFGLDLQQNIYRIFQEQLRNIMKYAEATRIEIKADIQNHILNIRIADNGKGFDQHIHSEGIGLANIQRRVALYHGKFEIITSPGNGCALSASIPIHDY